MPQNRRTGELTRIEKEQEEAFFVEGEGACDLEYVRTRFVSFTQKAARLNQFHSSFTFVLVLTPRPFLVEDYTDFCLNTKKKGAASRTQRNFFQD